MQECGEVIVKCGRKKSQAALFILAEDFRALRTSVQLNFRSAEEADGPELLPPDHPLAVVVSWRYLEQYLEAHASLPNEVLMWYKRHPEYPLRMHKALVEYF